MFEILYSLCTTKITHGRTDTGTPDESRQSEFRPGINREQDSIDLSGEFERQFFGDIMLFSVEKLTELGFPRTPVSRDSAVQTVMATEQDMQQKYLATRSQIICKLALLRSLFEDEKHWWNASSGAAGGFRQLYTQHGI
jgi:hypothetical protein